MERIHHEKYRCGGRNFFIETHRDRNRILFSVFDTAPETSLEQISVSDQFLTEETTFTNILKSTLYAEVLDGLKRQIAAYCESRD